MTWTRRFFRFCGVSLLIATTGCAAAYHEYPCGCIPFGYCAPSPLPYIAYDACPTPIAACYRSQHPPVTPTEPHLDEDWH